MGVSFGNCSVLCFLSSSKELSVELLCMERRLVTILSPLFLKKMINVIINEVNFYLHSSYASVGLRQLKVKSVQCKVLGISEFEIANYSNWS